eukprot:6190836-Pleurochrysis_carterae.AAC.5
MAHQLVPSKVLQIFGSVSSWFVKYTYSCDANPPAPSSFPSSLRELSTSRRNFCRDNPASSRTVASYPVRDSRAASSVRDAPHGRVKIVIPVFSSVRRGAPQRHRRAGADNSYLHIDRKLSLTAIEMQIQAPLMRFTMRDLTHTWMLCLLKRQGRLAAQHTEVATLVLLLS